MRNLLFLLSFLAAGCGGHYTNPLDVAFGDPFVLAASDGRFYMYGTSEGAAGFRVCVSDDLVTWSEAGIAYRRGQKQLAPQLFSPRR